MMGRSGTEDIISLKDEQGRILETREEVASAFRRKMEKTFQIDEEENDEFDHITEREVLACVELVYA